MRKNNNLIGLIISGVILLGASCERSDDPVIGEIDGTYVGTFTESSSLKSALINEGGAHGTAEVVMIEENQIQVHCFGEEIDTTFFLDYYEHNDEHFGGFNLQDGTFAYTFRMMENPTPYYLKFHGTKE